MRQAGEECSLFGGRGDGTGGRGEDEAVAAEGEALLGEFGLEELVVRAGEELCLGSSDGGDQVVDHDGFAFEGALFVAVGGELDGLD